MRHFFRVDNQLSPCCLLQKLFCPMNCLVKNPLTIESSGGEKNFLKTLWPEYDTVLNVICKNAFGCIGS